MSVRSSSLASVVTSCLIALAAGTISIGDGVVAEETPSEGLTLLMTVLAEVDEPASQLDLLDGMFHALQGRRRVVAPAGWKSLYPKLAKSSSIQVRQRALQIALVFGDPLATAELLAQLRDRTRDAASRQQALHLLVQYQVPEVVPDLLQMLEQSSERIAAIRGLAAFNDERIGNTLIRHYDRFSPSERSMALATLSSRLDYARQLLRALESRDIPSQDLTAFHARQVESLEDPQLTVKLRALWGNVTQTSAEQKQLIDRYKTRLTPTFLAQGNTKSGQALFKQHCMNCHRLYGKGGEIGPDITGSNRDNLDYLLENILAPSSVVPNAFKVKTLLLTDGRILNGFFVEQSPQKVTVQTATERVVVDRSLIAELKVSDRSMMPDGIAEKMSDVQFRDLIVYLNNKNSPSTPNDDTANRRLDD